MLPKMFYRARAERLARTYGTNIDLWPVYEQDQARRFFSQSDRREDLKPDARLDQALARLRSQPLSDDSLWQALSLIIGAPHQARIYDFDGAHAPVDLSALRPDLSGEGFRPVSKPSAPHAPARKVATKRKLFFG